MAEGAPRILVVDDDELMCQIIARALERSGWACQCAGDGAEALELSRARAYDLILTDLGMPVMDGISFIERIRSGATNARTPIIVVSCRALDPASFVREHPVQGYLAKPFALEELLGSVAEVLGRERGPEPGEEVRTR